MCGDVVWRDVGRDFLIRRRDGAAAGPHQQWLLVCNAWAQVAQLLAEPLAISLYDKDASRLDRDDSLGKATLDLSPLRTQYAAALTGTVLYKRSQPRGQVHAVVSWVSGEEPSGDQAGQQQPPSSGRAAQPPPGLQGLRLPAVKLPPRPARLSLGRVGRRQAASIRGQHGASPDGSAYSPSGGSDLAV